ncbi:class A sortase [Solibacillus silvestris]|uniref:class A sortase n=1 Tax=Solibacillus silvestris TaxID=76853 RepID=UPI003F803129
MKKTVKFFFIALLLIFGLIFTFHYPLQVLLVSKGSEELVKKEIVSVDEVQEANFQFQTVQTLEIMDVLKAQLKKRDFSVIGSIAIPSVDLELPIGKGVSESVIALGAGTLKPDQQPGAGNYALASHYIEGKDILFGPLYHVQIGDIAYISDKDFIHEYKISTIEVIQDSDVHVIYDVEDQVLLTLITCAEAGTKRLLVQGEWIQSYPI